MRVTFRKFSVGLIAAVGLAAALAPIASAHGPMDYHVIEYHYVQMGPYYYVVPYAQHDYYCDGHYEFHPGNGGSQGLAYTQTYDDTTCS